MWGMGRRALGSQMLDYWYGPGGFTVEHYTDGDVVNEGKTSRSGLSRTA